MTDPTPPPGAFNYLLGEPIKQTIEVPIPDALKGAQATLRVEITANARVRPSRAWAVAIMVWGLLVLLLLMRAAHSEQPNRWDWTSQHWTQRDWGTTQHFYTETPRGTERCAVWNWRGEQHVRCGE